MEKILWAEGTLLNQQVFQQWDRLWSDHLTQINQLHTPDGWGLSQLAISSQGLQNNKLSISKLEMITDNGCLINYSHLKNPPLIIELLQEEETVYLQIKQGQSVSAIPGYPEPSDQAAYRAYSKTYPDLYDHSRQSNLSFIEPILSLSTAKETTGYYTMPIANMSKTKDGCYHFCDTFIPPLMFIQCCRHLVERCQSISSIINQLCTTTTQYSLQATIDYRTILHLTNTELKILLTTDKTRPRTLFNILSTLDQLMDPDPSLIRAYNHASPADSLLPLLNRINISLKNLQATPDLSISFKIDDNNILYFPSLNHLGKNHNIVIYCRTSHEKNISIAELQLQIKSEKQSKIHDTISHSLPGIPVDIVHTHNTKDNKYYSVFIKTSALKPPANKQQNIENLCVYIPPPLTIINASTDH